MALVTSLDPIHKDRQTVHQPARCHSSVFTADGKQVAIQLYIEIFLGHTRRGYLHFIIFRCLFDVNRGDGSVGVRIIGQSPIKNVTVK